MYSNVGNLKNSHLDRLDTNELRAAGFNPDLLQDVNSSYYAAVYRDTITGDVIVANRGTQPAGTVEGAKDWDANFAQNKGLSTDQYEQAVDVARAAQRAFGNDVDFAGHSLGGGLAAAQAAATGLDGTTFNAAGLHGDTLSRLGITRAQADELVTAFHVGGEVLSLGQDYVELSTPIGTIDPLSDAVGQRISLPTINSRGEELGFFGQTWDTLSGTFDLHGMDAVLQSLNEYHARAEIERRALGN